jgi:hypothetical protein
MTVPQGVTATFKGWRSTSKPKDFRNAPCQWEGRIEFRHVAEAGDDIAPDAMIAIEVKGMRQLRVPIVSLP